MGIASGISHMFQSVVEVIQGIFMAIVHFFQLALQAVADLGKGAVNFIEGTLGFAIHNFFILGTIAAVVLGYMLYQQRQGTTSASKAIKSN